jgi:hypothetical protein
MALTPEEEEELARLEAEFGTQDAEPVAASALTPEEEEELAQLEAEFGKEPTAATSLTPEEEKELAQLEAEFGKVHDPSAGQIVAGVGAEIATGVGGQLAGTAIGTAILPGIGTAVGYVVGSIGSGILGSIAAQKLEGREDISWGRTIAAGLINLAPGGTGKGAKGAITLGKVATREAAKGAAFGATEATSRAIIDEGRLPTAGELVQYGGVGALFGGTVGPTATKISRKFAGKTPQQIDEAIARGEIDYKDLNWVLKQGQVAPKTDDMPSMEGFLRREVAQTRERVMAEEAATALAQPNKLRLPTTMKRIYASIAPSRTTGRGVQEEAISFKNKINAAESEASRIERSINKFIERNPKVASKVDDFLDGADIDPSLEPVAAQLQRYRETMNELQTELIQQLDDGQMQHLGEDSRKALLNAVHQSQKEKNYVTREYEIFTNKNFKQDPVKRLAAERELRNYYIGEGQTVEAATESAKKHIDNLVGKSARNMADKPQGSVGASLEGILRKRKQPGPAEREFLGEIVDVGAKMRGTLTRTARLVARNSADDNIARTLEDVGLASRVQREGMDSLNLRSRDETGLFVNPEVQIAVNKLYADNFIDKSGDIIEDGAKDLISSGIGLSKAVKVIGNVPSYAVQLWGNASNLIGMGINPFNPSKMSRGMRLALSDFGWVEDLSKSPKARKALLDDMRTMEIYGLKGGNIIESDLRATLDQGLFSKTVGKAVEPFGKVYSSLDVMGRYVGWKANQNTIRKLFPTLGDEDVKKFAARMINDTYQNYDKLSNTVRWATKWGAMPQFASFTAEFARNQYNQGRIIKQMLNGTYGKDFGLQVAPEQLRAMQREGAKRLASLVAVYGGAYGITEAIKSESGVDPKKEAALRETVLPEWDRNKQLAIALSEDGTAGSYANMSYILPQSVGVAALRAGMDGSDITSLSGLIVEELVGEGTFINKAAMQALDNRNDRGKPISYSEDEFGQFKDRLGYFITQSFKPGTAREIDKMMKAQRGVGDYTMKEIAARQVGYRVNKFDVAEQAQFTIKRTNDNLNLAKTDYNSQRDYGDVSPQQLERTYQEANAAAKKSFDQMVRHNENLATLGLTEEQRIDVMREAGLSSENILNVLEGKYADIPRIETKSTSDIYDELTGSNQEKVAEIRKISKEDPKLGKELFGKHKDMLLAERRDISERDKLLLALGTEKRALRLYEMGILENRELLRKMMSKKIATPEVLFAIHRRHRAENAPNLGGY